jgi:hypothetical protein
MVQVEQWIHDHDTHPWASSSQEHTVRGPDERGATALIKQRKKFVRVYVYFRVTTQPILAMGRWSAPGVGQAADGYADLPLPDVPDGCSEKAAGMFRVPPASNARPTEEMAHARYDVSGETVLSDVKPVCVTLQSLVLSIRKLCTDLWKILHDNNNSVLTEWNYERISYKPYVTTREV